jgi:hypothetical protein
VSASHDPWILATITRAPPGPNLTTFLSSGLCTPVACGSVPELIGHTGEWAYDPDGGFVRLAEEAEEAEEAPSAPQSQQPPKFSTAASMVEEAGEERDLRV